MNYYLVLRNIENSYLLAPSYPLSICYLGYLLADEVKNEAFEFIQWFKDPANDAGSGNVVEYIVDEGELLIFPSWKKEDYDECIRNGWFFCIKFELVLEILRQWAPVYKARPPYITITIIDDVVEVKGSDTYEEDMSSWVK